MNSLGHVQFLVLGLALLAGAAQAQRDPTQPPPEALATPAAAGATASDGPWGGTAGMAVVVRDGKPFVVSGTRLYGVGQKVGEMQITQISETEVWLRRGTEVRKLPRFAGIQRKPSDEARGSTP